MNSKQLSYSVQKEIKERNKQECQEKISTEEDQSPATRGECLDREIFYDCNEDIDDRKFSKSLENNLLRIASYTCIFFVYFQLSLLMCLISYTQLKMGFIFLLCCAFILCSFMLQVSFEFLKFWVFLSTQLFHDCEKLRLYVKIFQTCTTFWMVLKYINCD